MMMSSESLVNAKRPRVLLSGHLPPPMSGIGTYYQTLLNSSLPKRVDLKFIDTSSRRRAGSETGNWSFSNVVSAVWDCVRFTKAAIIHRPEVSHIATAFGLSFLKHSVCVVIARLVGSRVLLHPHCSFYYLYEAQGKTWQWLVRKVIGLCHGLIVLSNEWKKLWDVCPACQIYYLPNAIDLSSYTEVAQKKIATKFDQPCLHVLYLGHLGKDKGSFDLIDAAKTILEKQPGTIFDLVGHEQMIGDIDRLHRQVKEAGLEQFIHVRSAVASAEKIQLFQVADIFVYPSYHEGMPMAVIEAMACGLPIIATEVGGLPDLVHDSVNGLLIPTGQPDQLAKAIQELAVNPQMRHFMQERSFEMAKDFDVEKLVGRLLEIYRAILLPDRKPEVSGL